MHHILVIIYIITIPNMSIEENQKDKSDSIKKESKLPAIIIFLLILVPTIGIQFYQKYKESYEYTPTPVIQKASEDEIYSVLQKMTQELGKDTPKKLDDITTLSSVSIEWRTTLAYNYTVTSDWEQVDEFQRSKDELNLQFQVCKNFKTYIQYGMSVVYNYKNLEWKPLKSYTFDSSNCH